MLSKKLTVVFFIFSMFLRVPLTFGEVFFADDFETGDLTKIGTAGAGWAGSNVGTGDTVSVTTGIARSGTYSVKFHYDGNPDLVDDALAELRYKLKGTAGSGYQDFYMRYYIYYPTNFYIRDAVGPDNNKIGTTWGEEYSDRAKFNVEWEKGSSMGFKIPRDNTWPHTALVCEGAIAPGPDAPRWTMDSSYLGRWVAWEFHYKMDDGSSNGAWELWIDGVQKISVTGMSFVGAPCRPGYIRNGYLQGWANSGFTNDTDIYIDDVVFSTSYIGTDIPSDTPTLPEPPSDFQKGN
ncbi:MAG: heparin lyase I family protein [Desulfocapsa sp.]|uniref:Heparin lyase I family protein n=1 Tax=Desulfotalea psychrophila TaxID=84980 RepID=A0ABS3AWX6_9BACT|nr:heparin lyase I family protein [Desulfocapsa sp.]MBN4068387.1 heparin lyase I family protein [Desulfotalea psychrophila]